ncbi:MAG: SLATT domain-containing protein [Bacteroidetes bacterium]|nr:SLATT domain-containing protein [Bacteroidota bacterium]
MDKKNNPPNPPPFIPPLQQWKEAEGRDKLKELFADILKKADDTIHWYHTCRRKKGNAAKAIRISAIILLIACTLMPYIASITDDKTKMTILSIGYILAGVGGGILLLDRYYGLTSSWIRFVLTGMDLENMRNAFADNWQILYLGSLPLTREKFVDLVAAMISFQTSFNATVKKETETWAREFQQNLKDLMAALQQKGEELRQDLEEQRQAIADKDQPAPTIDEVPSEVLREAISANYSKWRDLFGVVAVSVGPKMTGGQRTATNSLIFSPTKKIEEGDRHFVPIPPVIRYKAANGETYNIPTDVQATGSAIKASIKPKGLCDNSIPKRPGCSVSRANDNDNSGTFGLVVFRNKNTFLLSCYHVLCAGELNAGTVLFPTNGVTDATVVSPSKDDNPNGLALGNVTEGELDNQIDGAIALIDDPINVMSTICSLDFAPKAALIVTDEQAHERHPVVSVGRTSGVITGAIRTAFANCDIHYRIGNQWKVRTLEGLICTDQVSQPGDSGAAVLDNDHNVIGIIAGNSDEFTYIIPIRRLLSRFSVTLKAQ